MTMRLFFTILLLVAWILPAQALQLRDPESHFFDETFGDLQEELATAKEQGKKAILIMFEMEECPFCRRMKSKVLNRDDIQDYFREHFLILTMDVEGDLEITDFQGNTTTQKEFALKQFRVRATPVFQFVDLDGKPIKKGRYTGATSDADEFKLLGQYVVDERYKETSFVRYKRQMKQEKKVKIFNLSTRFFFISIKPGRKYFRIIKNHNIIIVKIMNYILKLFMLNFTCFPMQYH